MINQRNNSLFLFITIFFSLLLLEIAIKTIGILTYPALKETTWLISWPVSILQIANLIKIPLYIFLFLILISHQIQKSSRQLSFKCIAIFILFIITDLIVFDANNLITSINISTLAFSNGMSSTSLNFNAHNIMQDVFVFSQIIIRILIFASICTYVLNYFITLKGQMIAATLAYIFTFITIALFNLFLTYFLDISRYRPPTPIWEQLLYGITHVKVTISLLMIWTIIAINHTRPMKQQLNTPSSQSILYFWVIPTILTIALPLLFITIIYVLDMFVDSNAFLKEIFYIINNSAIVFFISLFLYIIYLIIIWQNIHSFPYSLALSIVPLFYVMTYGFVYQTDKLTYVFSYSDAMFITEIFLVATTIFFSLLHFYKCKYLLKH